MKCTVIFVPGNVQPTETSIVIRTLIFVSGNAELDQVLQVLMGTAMFVGGVLAFVLDNTVPGEVSRVQAGTD